MRHAPVPLAHLAAFSQMLPELRDVAIGAADLSGAIRPELACDHIKDVRVACCESENHVHDDLLERLTVYFPNAKLFHPHSFHEFPRPKICQERVFALIHTGMLWESPNWASFGHAEYMG